MPTPPLLGPHLEAYRLRIADRDVEHLRSILEGYDGLASVYGDGTGTVLVIGPTARKRELESVLAELQQELGWTRIP